MPTTPKKARQLLKAGRAKVVKRNPFTIQLNYATGENRQPITLGIDTGAKFIGFSAVTEKAEIASGTVILDTMMKKHFDDRRMYRKHKRNKLWYRQPRFLNRVANKKEGWLPPSIKRRYQTHLTLISKIKKLFPITKVVVEIANFDIQKLVNPQIKGKEYQQGDMYGYRNVKSYVLARENYNCQMCGKSVKEKKINLHHIVPKSQGGTDRSSNLALLHETCHNKLHRQNLSLKGNRQYKEATFMNVVKNKFQQDIECDITYGYKTSTDRINLGLEKTHYNDAFVIAGGNGQTRMQPVEVIQKRKNNRCLQKNRKGFAPSIRRQRYSIQPKDLVLVNNKWVETGGVLNKGKRIYTGKKTINIKLVEKVFHAGTLSWRIPTPALA